MQVGAAVERVGANKPFEARFLPWREPFSFETPFKLLPALEVVPCHLGFSLPIKLSPPLEVVPSPSGCSLPLK